MASQSFNNPWLILCEGRDDHAFFSKLITHLGLRGSFEIRYPNKHNRDSGGRDKFGSWISNQLLDRTFVETVKAILIVSDSDEDPSKSFGQVQQSLKANNLPTPLAERSIARASGSPDIVVLMIPEGGAGNLETLCIKSALNKWHFEEVLNTFISQTPASAWDAGKQDKAKIHALLAVTCKSKPGTSLAYHWQEADEYHIPVNDPCFDDISTFLRDFETLITA